MIRITTPLACAVALSACTSVSVRPLDNSSATRHVCIQENPKVLVADFLDVVRDGLQRNGYTSQVYSGSKPAECEITLTYTALRNWDFALYMTHAELRLERNFKQIGYAEYHLVGGGGLSPMKWQGTKEKLDPVIDQLLAKQ